MNLNNSLNINVLWSNKFTSKVITIKCYVKEALEYTNILIIHNHWFHYDISMHACKVF